MNKVVTRIVTVGTVPELDTHIADVEQSIQFLIDDGWIISQRFASYLGDGQFNLMYILAFPDALRSDGPDLIRRALPELKLTRHEARVLHGRGIDAETFKTMSVEELAERLATLRSRKVAARLVSKRKLWDAQQKYTEEDANAWKGSFGTFVANAMQRARVPWWYVFRKTTTNDDLCAIPGIGKRVLQQLNNRRLYDLDWSEIGR